MSGKRTKDKSTLIAFLFRIVLLTFSIELIWIRTAFALEGSKGSKGRLETRPERLFTNELSQELWAKMKDDGAAESKQGARPNDAQQGYIPDGLHSDKLAKRDAIYTPDFLARLRGMNTIAVAQTPREEGPQMPNGKRQLNVFGDRPRRDVNETQFPFRAVGILSTRCTATVIQANLLLTNWHCIGQNMVFFAGFSEGSFVSVSLVRSYRSDPMMDWAILETTTNIGELTGWFAIEFRNLQFFSTRRWLNMISYSGDHCSSYSGKSSTCKAMLSHSCGSVRLQGNAFLHDCSMTRGSSGSAMFRAASTDALTTSSKTVPVIIGYNFGEFRVAEQSMTLPRFTAEYANAGRPSINFRSAFQAYMAEPDEASIPFCAPLCPPSFLDDQVCDQVCNFAACNFDSMRCDCAPGCPGRHISDGKCDAACNNAACGFDGVDCLPTPSPVSRSPVSRAPTKSPSVSRECAPGCLPEYINDTLCDLTCDVPECGFDGTDCGECAPGCLSSWVGDGMCDPECQVENCQFDGIDCQPTSSPVPQPQCAPGCLVSMIDDGFCQPQCRAASNCRFDGVDCLTMSPTLLPTTSSPSSLTNCAPGCPRVFVNNGRCDIACQVEACEFDGKDCDATAVPTRRARPSKRPTVRRRRPRNNRQ